MMSRLLAFLFLLLTFLLCLFPIQSNDLFMYLAVGNYRALHGSFPSVDPFIYSIPGETLYWHHHWLGAQLFYWTEQLFTLPATTVFKGLLLSLLPLMALVMIKKRGNEKPLAYLLLGLAIEVSCFRFIERTSIYSDVLTCFVLMIGLLERNKKAKWMWSFPPIFALWINLHPGFPLGIALVGFFWIFDFEPLPEKIKSTKLWILLLSCLALFCNPEGLQGILYPFLFAAHQGQVYKQYYFEWIPVYSSIYRSTPEAISFFCLLAASLIVVLKTRLRDPRLLLILIFAGFGLSAARFFNLSAFALLLLCLDLSLPSWFEFRHWQKGAAALIVFAAVKIMLFGYTTSAGHRDFRLGIDERSFPTKIADLYAQARTRGNVFNNHSFGDYLAWKWAGNPKIFFHGAVLNTDFYLNDYRRAVASEADFDRLSKKYNWTVMIVSRFENPAPFFQILSKRPEWRQGGEDESGYFFFKQSPP